MAKRWRWSCTHWQIFCGDCQQYTESVSLFRPSKCAYCESTWIAVKVKEKRKVKRAAK